jgi:hypothetical protein
MIKIEKADNGFILRTDIEDEVETLVFGYDNFSTEQDAFGALIHSLYDITPRRKIMIQNYRKKPVVIQACKFTRNNFDEIKEFTNQSAHSLTIEKHIDGKCTCIIPTLEGQHIASENDFIIKGVNGEFYPCKPDIFDKTYELA